MPLPQTEMTPDNHLSIDRLPRPEALARMLDGQAAAVEAVRTALPQIEEGAALMADTLRSGGRLVYAAAGSSGLMALADGAELPGTFGIPPAQIRICMAGGVPTDANMPGDTEDDAQAAARIVADLAPGDLVIALSASGTTPYPCAVVTLAQAAGIRTIGIASNPGSPLLSAVEVAICLPTPPEVLAGSTRLGAGTAQKVALNMMSTLTGVLLGHVHDGMMVNLHVDNAKLRRRARRIVARTTGETDDTASAALTRADGNTKLAILLALGSTTEEGVALLRAHDDHLGPCIAALRGAANQ